MSDEGIYLAIKAKVKGATKAVLGETDWSANLEIVDMLNGRPSYAEYIARVLKKRIRHWNPVVGILSLTLTESLVKNCPCFHPYVAHPNFMDSMLTELYRKKPKKTLLQKVKVQTPVVSEISKLQRRDKILLLIESWGKSFADSQAYPVFRETYENLLRQNYRFPHPLKDEVSPVFTPAAKPRVLKDTDTSGPIKDYGLQNTIANIELFMDTLNETSKRSDLRQNDTVQALLRNLQAAQEEIMQRINNNPSEELMVELLLANDEICQATNFYNGLLDGTNKRRKKQKNSPPSNSKPKSKSKPKRRQTDSDSLSAEESSGAVEDLLGLGAMVPASSRAPVTPVNNMSESEASYDSESGDDSEESEESEEETDSEEESELELSTKEMALAIAPPPSSGKGKGKSRRNDNGSGRGGGGSKQKRLESGNSNSSKQMVVADPWAVGLPNAKSIDDDPFGSFGNPVASKAPLQIGAPPVQAHEQDDFLAIALRGATVSAPPSQAYNSQGQQGQMVLRNQHRSSPNPFDPL